MFSVFFFFSFLFNWISWLIVSLSGKDDYFMSFFFCLDAAGLFVFSGESHDGHHRFQMSRNLGSSKLEIVVPRFHENGRSSWLHYFAGNLEIRCPFSRFCQQWHSSWISQWCLAASIYHDWLMGIMIDSWPKGPRRKNWTAVIILEAIRIFRDKKHPSLKIP